MIVFDLKCTNGHTFEEWFTSAAESEARLDAHDLPCPECGDSHVTKTLSAPRINGGAPAPATPCGRPACGAGVCEMMN